jgi:type I restriction enzyme M protein
MFERTYEYLIKMFADDAGKKGGFFIHHHLLVKLIKPEKGMRVYDPSVDQVVC